MAPNCGEPLHGVDGPMDGETFASSHDATRAQAVRASEEITALGSVVLRQVWPTGPLAELRSAIATFCDKRRIDVEEGRFAHATAKMYASHGVGTVSGLIHDGLMKPVQMVRLFEGSLYADICRAYFGSDRLYCQLSRCGFREHRTSISRKSFIPYHQDSYSQDEQITDVLNCWIPLDPCGVSAPGLEVVRNPCHPDFPRKDFGLASENAAYDFITIDRGEVIKAFGDCFLAPSFDVGDCLIFSQNVIHRTYVTGAMDQPRINFELRIFAEHCMRPEARDLMIRDGNVTRLSH